MAAANVQQATTGVGLDRECAALINVRKRYGATVALDDLTLRIGAGELVAVLGPNGAGKSTAIALLLGLLRPDRGEVRLFGQPPTLRERRRLGVMMQEVSLSPDLKAREHIDLAASYYPAPYALDELTDLTGIGAFCHKRYGDLSGGQKRQVQFAMALCGRPSLLFLDEPTVGLDIPARTRMWETIRTLVAQGSSVVLTTHHLEEAEALAHRVVVMARGRQIAQGSVKEIRALVARKTISCVTTLPPERLRAWDGVQAVSIVDGFTQLTVSEAEPVVRRLLAADPHLADLEIRRAGLADAFVELTKEQ